MSDSLSSSADGAVPYGPEDWEDWLRWDPTAEPLSPGSASKDSSSQYHSPNQDTIDQPDPFVSIAKDETLAPPLIADDVEDMMEHTPSWSFSDYDSNAPPYVFGASGQQLQPIVTHFQPSDPTWQQAPVQSHSLTVPSTRFLDPTTQTFVPRASSQQLETQYLSPSAASQTNSATSPLDSAAPARKKPGRKRKSSAVEEGKERDSASNEDEPPVKKTSHNVIEKRYRNNLNDKIIELRDSVPSLRAMSQPGDGGPEDLEGLTPAHKLNKTTVMAKATEYIKHLEKRNKTMAEEMDNMRSRLAALENAISGSGNLSLQQAQARAGRSPSNVPQPGTPSGHSNQFSSPQNMSGYDTPSGDSTQVQYPPRQHRGQSRISKAIVGSMAGMMVMEGLHEHDPSGQGPSSRGLFALPMHLFGFGSFNSASSTSMASAMSWSLLRLTILFSAVLYLVLPLLKSKPPPKAQAQTPMRLTGAPSLASPVEVRRQAWLTAVQSVWQPRHFLLEVVAVTLRMMKLSLRRLIGSESYFMISGITQEQEAARIKAWDIAIDAQLAGGDAQVSYYRLLLTLMASGTLPDSPGRLMQKAVHFRIFFWEVANAGYGNMSYFQEFTAKVARIYWNSARTQQKALLAGDETARDELDKHNDPLPAHLAALLELDCDEVLTNEVIQRAYNLAWNRPSSENTVFQPTLDSVVEDHAIRSPLDAVAAWYANRTIDDALAMSLHPGSSTLSDVKYLVELAVKAAPPASVTETRVLVARAVLLEDGREANIAAALDTLPAQGVSTPTRRSSLETRPMNLVDHVPVSPDIRVSLTLSKLLSVSAPTSPLYARLHAASALSKLAITPNSFSLLTAVAAHKVLEAFSGDELLFRNSSAGMDGLASTLRLWVGTRAGKRTCLSSNEKGYMVDGCLSVVKRLGGWSEEDHDSGYGSASPVASEASLAAF